MSEEGQKQMGAMLTSSGDFILAQAPEVIQQYLYWGVIYRVVWIMVLVGAIWLGYKLFSCWGEQGESRSIGAMLGGILVVLAFAAIVASSLTIAQILITPKVYLVEAAAKLIHK